ncbi:MAG: hypothetical protein OHK93_006326 [Ramalina farinacea]|uniref:Uncharacterized protein n=1 Tax=Ramalina farinacea TaxID=258253 RepID=A0AA43QIB6_9LECA|nr:hypothetical protein [Ramalina farinacea]
MAGNSSRSSRPAPLSPYNFDDPFESTAVPGAEQRSGGSSALFHTSTKRLEAGPDNDFDAPDHLSRASALESWRSTPSPKKKSRKQWNGEYLYLSTPRQGPRLERVSPIPLEYDQPIAETTPSASSDDFEPDVNSPLFQKSVEALRREGWGKAFQQQKTSDDASSSEAETEILESDPDAGPGLSALPEDSWNTRSEPALAFLEEPSTAREFDAGLLLGKINFQTTSASARSFNSKCLVSRISHSNHSKSDRAHSTTATPQSAVQAYKATGLVREVDIHTPSSTNPSSRNQSRLKRKSKFEVQRDAAKAPTKRDAPKENDGRPPTVLKDKTNLPLRMRYLPQQPSPDSLKQKRSTANRKLQQSQHSLPDALKAGFIRNPEPAEDPLRPPTAIRKAAPGNLKTTATLGPAGIPQPSPRPTSSITPPKRTIKPIVRLPGYRSGRYFSPDRAQAISRTLAVLEQRAPSNPPYISPPLVRHAILGPSRIPQPSPLPAKLVRPSKRTHKPRVRLPEYHGDRFLSPDHAQAISQTLAVLERRAPHDPPSDSPPLVRYARRGKQGYTENVQFDQDELVLHQPTPMRGKMAMRKVVERFEKMAMDAEEEVIRQQMLSELGEA